jgi:hypothetical protein
MWQNTNFGCFRVALDEVEVLRWHFAKFKILEWHEANFPLYKLKILMKLTVIIGAEP